MSITNEQQNNFIQGSEADKKSASDFISVDEMAKMLSIARVTAYQLTKTSGFPCFYIGKRIIIPLQSFQLWAAEQAANHSNIL